MIMSDEPIRLKYNVNVYTAHVGVDLINAVPAVVIIFIYRKYSSFLRIIGVFAI